MVFATYVMVDEGNVLDADTAFVSMSFINLLVLPFSLLPDGVAVIGQVCSPFLYELLFSLSFYFAMSVLLAHNIHALSDVACA